MRWPFKTDLETDVRIFRDPKTNQVTLRLVGPICFPGPDFPIVTASITLDAIMNEEGIERLHQQLRHFAEEELEREDCQ